MAIRPVPEGGSRASASPAYERVPPHNVEAEESVLGSMLLSKDAIAEVLELLREDDFYRPAHRTVFRSVLELYGHGDAVDAVTVQEELRRSGALADIGGAPFLHTLVASVPTAANAGYYARIVKEAGVLRRLIDVGTQIVQLGFETPQDTERAVDIAESLVYQVAQGRVTEDYHSLRDVLTGTLEAIERLHEDHREITGVPTGFADLDRLTSGLQPANLVIVAARPAVGKALAVDTPLPTPTGWCGRQADDRCRRDRDPARPTLLRGRVLGRDRHRRRRTAPVADRDPGIAQVGMGGRPGVQPLPDPADAPLGQDHRRDSRDAPLQRLRAVAEPCRGQYQAPRPPRAEVAAPALRPRSLARRRPRGRRKDHDRRPGDHRPPGGRWIVGRARQRPELLPASP